MSDAGEVIARLAESLNLIATLVSDDTYRALCLRSTGAECENAVARAIEEAVAGCRVIAGKAEAGGEAFASALQILEKMQRALHDGGLDDHVRHLAGQVVQVFKARSKPG